MAIEDIETIQPVEFQVPHWQVLDWFNGLLDGVEVFTDEQKVDFYACMRDHLGEREEDPDGQMEAIRSKRNALANYGKSKFTFEGWFEMRKKSHSNHYNYMPASGREPEYKDPVEIWIRDVYYALNVLSGQLSIPQSRAKLIALLPVHLDTVTEIIRNRFVDTIDQQISDTGESYSELYSD